MKRNSSGSKESISDFEYLTDIAFSLSGSSLENCRSKSVLLYVSKNTLDLADKASCNAACKKLNLTFRQLEDIIKDFELFELVEIRDGLPSINVLLTKTGSEVLKSICNSI